MTNIKKKKIHSETTQTIRTDILYLLEVITSVILFGEKKVDKHRLMGLIKGMQQSINGKP